MLEGSRRETTESARVEVWRAEHEALPPPRLKLYEQWLTPAERARQLRYRRPQDQKRFAVGRGMLRQLLEKYTGRPAAQWRFSLGEYGRPELQLSDHEEGVPRFNLSHSRGVTVAAFGLGVFRLGADVEAMDRTSHSNLASRYFAPSEARKVEQANSAVQGELFLRFWTLKEAYVKAVGQGISLGLDSFAFELFDEAPPRVAFARASAGESPDQWHFFELPWATERVALAIECQRRPQVIMRDFASDV